MHMVRLLVAKATRPPFGTAGPPELYSCSPLRFASEAIMHTFSGSAGDFEIQTGIVKKNAAFVVVQFEKPFDNIPVVNLTPLWGDVNDPTARTEGVDDEVKHVDTIQQLSKSKFIIVSDNQADNLYIMYTAIGLKRTGE
jgi:hypothetical protein